jgi:hypothetical protein
MSIAAVSPKSSLSAGGLDLSTDFTCGAGCGIEALGEGHFSLVIPPDPPSLSHAAGYDYYFNVSVENKTAEKALVTLDALRPGASGGEIDWHPSAVPVYASGDLSRWYVLDDVRSCLDHHNYRIKISLSPGEEVFIANSFPYPPERMVKWLSRTEETHNPLAKLHPLGRSAEGREILLLSIAEGDSPGKDRVLITSGFHPAEPDWLAATAIADFLLSEDPLAKRMRDAFVFDIVPQVNPDGFDLGTNGCNAHGVNMYWEYLAGDADSSPEAAHLWDWIRAHPPAVYMDFHAYVFQMQKDFRPYIRPLSDYPSSVWPLVREADRRLISLCDGRAVRGAITNDPSTLAAQITKAFGSITYTKFHLHMKYGPAECQKLGREVFLSVIEPALGYLPLGPRVRREKGITFAERWRFRLEQSRPAIRLRALGRRALAILGLWDAGVGRASGTKELLRREDHLWSRRESQEPVIVIGEDSISF